jgi:hypothetical protein
MLNKKHIIEPVLANPKAVLCDYIDRVVTEHSYGRDYIEDTSPCYYRALAVVSESTLVVRVVSDFGLEKESLNVK